jgi:hypothetical protein
VNINPAGCSIIFSYTESSQWPSSCVFINCEFGSTNAVSNSGTPGSGARPNYLVGHSETNGVPNPNLTNLYPALPTIVAPGVALTNQTASITTTNITPIPTYLPAMFRVSGYLEITTAGNAVTVSVTIGWTDDSGATQAFTSAAISAAAKNFTTVEIPIRVAQGTNVAFLTTVSGAIGAGRYALCIKLEKLD